MKKQAKDTELRLSFRPQKKTFPIRISEEAYKIVARAAQKKGMFGTRIIDEMAEIYEEQTSEK